MRAFASALTRSELRAHPREIVNRRAKVLDGGFALDALLRNISVGGALLAFSGRMPVTDEFVVVDLPLGTAYACRVVWRKGTDCGVRILKTQDLRGLVPGQFDPAKRAWRHAAS